MKRIFLGKMGKIYTKAHPQKTEFDKEEFLRKCRAGEVPLKTIQDLLRIILKRENSKVSRYSVYTKKNPRSRIRAY